MIMEEKINNIKVQLIISYIEKIDKAVENYDVIDNTADEIFNLIIEISNVMPVSYTHLIKLLRKLNNREDSRL